MSAVDKLHKLYSSTLEPVVWARSVGLEVLNEIDFLKAAIMMDAGARSPQKNTQGDAIGWTLVAKGIETLASSASAANIIGQGISGAVRTGSQNVLRATASRNE
jgi:ubiquinone biosynthesis monooxygenase Coq6